MVDAILKLLKGLNHQFSLSERQIRFGVKKAENYVQETLKLDVPNSPELFAKIQENLKNIPFEKEA